MTTPATTAPVRLPPAYATVSGEPHHSLICGACDLALAERHRFVWVTEDGRVWCSSCVAAPSVLPPAGRLGKKQLGPPPAARVVMGGSRESVAAFVAQAAHTLHAQPVSGLVSASSPDQQTGAFGGHRA